MTNDIKDRSSKKEDAENHIKKFKELEEKFERLSLVVNEIYVKHD